MYCKYCGSEIDDDSLVCCYCGKHLYKNQPRNASERIVNPRNRAQREEDRQNRTPIVHDNRGRNNPEHEPRYLSEDQKIKKPWEIIARILMSLLSTGLLLWGINYSGILDDRGLDYDDRREAYNISKEIIAEDLMSPKSADFPRFSTDFVMQRYEEVMHEGEEYHVYPVRAYVDAQNMFGTVSRSYYIVEVGLPQNSDIEGYIYNVVYEDIEAPPELHEYKEVLGLTNTEEVVLPADENPIAAPEQTAVPEENSTVAETEYFNPKNFPTPEEQLASVVYGGGVLNLNGELLNLYEITKVVDYMDGTEILQPIEFCVVDIDQDGKSEIVITLAGEGGNPWRLILRYQEENIFGYGFPYRGLKSISVDGWCEGSSGASETSVLRLSFDATEVTAETLDAEVAETIWTEWEEVTWHEFTEENINQYIGYKQ